MKDEKNIDNILQDVVRDIAKNYHDEPLFYLEPEKRLPNRTNIIRIIKDLRAVMFPGYFGTGYLGKNVFGKNLPQYFVGDILVQLHQHLTEEIYYALLHYAGNDETADAIRVRANDICLSFFQTLKRTQQLLIKDVQAAFDGDPAAHSKEDIILSYPGLFAIFVYRIAHEIYLRKVPFIPRIMSEYAHSRTGIDINPGATIGENFFIDHGTGVVIGETTQIGNNVKIYQGVTLGALSTRSGQLLSGVKRHPTIEDNVTIYSSASILGGETVIGENSIIGGNAFIVKSIPKNTRVSIKPPELTCSDTDDGEDF